MQIAKLAPTVLLCSLTASFVLAAGLPRENSPYNASDELQAKSNEEEVRHFDHSKTYWWHNGSTVLLEADGHLRRISYESPRPGMVQAGAMKGSVLFEGSARGDRVGGTAYIFNRKCGRIPYDVVGRMIRDRCGIQSIEMVGLAPRVNGQCIVTSRKRDDLVFTLVRFDYLPGTDGNYCEQ